MRAVHQPRERSDRVDTRHIRHDAEAFQSKGEGHTTLHFALCSSDRGPSAGRAAWKVGDPARATSAAWAKDDNLQAETGEEAVRWRKV